MGTVFDVSGNTAYSPKNPYNGMKKPIHFPLPRPSVEQAPADQNSSVCRKRRLARPGSIFTEAGGL